MLQATSSVEPGAEHKANRGGINSARLDPRLGHQHLHSGAMRGIEPLQATGYQGSILTLQGSQVGHGAQGHQVKQLL